MSNVNDNNQQVKGTPVPSPQGTPRNSREASPERSTTHNNEQHGNEQTIEQDAVKQLIAEYVNDALQGFVRGLPAMPPAPPPYNTVTVEISRSGLVNSGSGGTPNESRNGRPDLFIKVHPGEQKVKKRIEDIFKVNQGDTELLREFIDRFQRERMLLPRVPDNWAAMAFASNLNEKSSEATMRLKESLREFPATIWNDVYNRYITKLRIEEDIVAQSRVEEKTGSRRSECEKRSGKNRYEPYMGPSGREARSKFENVQADHRLANRDSSSSSSRFRKDRGECNRDANTNARIGDYHFNVSTSELVAVLRSKGDKVRWPKEMRSNPNRRNLDFWCEFHNDHDHRTSDCRLLQGDVEHLLKRGYLTELFSEKGKQAYMKNRQETPKPPSPKRTINVINDGEEVNDVTYTAARKTTKFTITHGKRTRQTLEDGSSVNIILLQAVNEMLMGDRVVPKARSLSGFDNSTIITKGEIKLSTYTEGVIKETKFQVIDTNMAYNVILGRPWIHDMDVVPSTLHQVIKFPSKWGIQ
uniref:Retrotransposon gag domain-containing protein n=1 Tax=Nicotiana tabacum TaxID=4097 RepID=A0A1S4ACV2_TOBAC|nr:PREDICTED: uncharacterized protein LOC107796208 [Nicotiana tabacum]